MILLTTTGVAADAARLVELNSGGAIPLTQLPTFGPHWKDNPRWMFPTVSVVLRAALTVPQPALLMVNCVPVNLAPIPNGYEVNLADAEFMPCKPLPTRPGVLGVDFAIAVAFSQLAVATRLAAAGMQDHASFFIEAAGLSAACSCSLASTEIMEKMFRGFCDGPESFPWPDGILWPDQVNNWLKGFDFPTDERG